MTKLAFVRTAMLAVLGTTTLVGLRAGSAAADPPSNGHDCAGAVVSGLAGPDLGPTVAGLAQQQLVDNLGLADCGAPPRANP